IFLGLEVMSISFYILSGYLRSRPRSVEAGMKYFLMGAFATGILFYGIVLLYGVSKPVGDWAEVAGARATMDLGDLSRYLTVAMAQAGGNVREIPNHGVLLLGLGLLIIGFGFKIAAVPFHMWTPDVYEGAPTPLTAFMSVGPKVAAFAVIMRVYMTSFNTLALDWTQLFWLLAVLTMIGGNVIAVAQKNIKRMLAYSSIAHAGYLLVGVVAAGSAVDLSNASEALTALTSESMTSVMVYLFAYMFMNMGAFAIIIALGRADDPRESLQDYAGLAERRPITAMLMTILMLSLAGIPPTFGFIGKFYIFKAAIQTYNTPLAVIGVITSVVAAFYYIRVIVYMYMYEPVDEVVGDAEPADSTMYAAIASVIFTLMFGIAPGAIIGMARYTIEQMLA
ncbi:MAG: NADH-quinone oxidoreductase subunit N, partial [Candidatus Abyssubacteria bacterium]|nr:NADH-quinone oxidoreductase subunit N [Candidatus Abyssubacteria bacterium]